MTDAEHRSTAASIGILTRLSGLDADGRRQMTGPARETFAEQLRAEHAAKVDPDGILAATDPAEFERRMKVERSLHMRRVSLARHQKDREARLAAEREARLAAEYAAIADATLAAEESA